MATYSYQIDTDNEGGWTLNVLPTHSPGAPRVLVAGDVLSFWYFNDAGSDVTISTFDSDLFTNSANVVLTFTGQTITRTVKTPPASRADTLTVSSANGGVKTIYFDFQGLDEDPDPFTLTDYTDAATNTDHYSGFLVSGISGNVAVSITGSGSFSIGNDPFTVVAGTCLDGDRIRVKLKSAVAYSTAVNTVLTIGTGSDTMTVTTSAPPDPSSGALTASNFTLPISGADIMDFFGVTPRNMLSCYYGGDYVANLPTQNSGIPSSGNIRPTDFVGAYTSHFIIKEASFQFFSADTSGGGGGFDVRWDINGTTQDWDVGYGIGARAACEFKYVLTANNKDSPTPGSVPDAVLASNSGSPGTYSASNTQCRIDIISYPTNKECEYTGTVVMYARRTNDPTKIVTTTADYQIYLYGP